MANALHKDLAKWKWVKLMMNKEQLVEEIRRVEVALQNTTSRKLKHDYGRYLKRLYQNLKYYDKHHRTANNAV